MKNTGKKFEKEWKDSIPPEIFYYRFRDGTGAWGNSNTEESKTRFQAKNMCDCEMFDGNKLFLLELKSHKGKSLPLKTIRSNQIEELSKASKFNNVVAGIVINYADLGQTFYLHIADIENFINDAEQKSIPLAWCERFGIKVYGQLKKVNYRWNIREFIENFSEVAV